MDYSQFVAEVQQRAEFESPEDAEKAIDAVLETLGERLTSNDAHSLAEQLPIELGQTVKGAMSGQDFGVDDFINRVSYREGVDMTEAEIHTRVILEVVKESVSPGMVNHIHGRLKGQFDSLFMGPSKGHVPGGHR